MSVDATDPSQTENLPPQDSQPQQELKSPLSVRDMSPTEMRWLEKKREAARRAAKKNRLSKKRQLVEKRRTEKQALLADAAALPLPVSKNISTLHDEAGTVLADIESTAIADAPLAVHEVEAVEMKVSFPAALKKIEITDHGILLTTDSFPGDLEALTKFLEQDAVMTLELPAVKIK